MSTAEKILISLVAILFCVILFMFLQNEENISNHDKENNSYLIQDSY